MHVNEWWSFLVVKLAFSYSFYLAFFHSCTSRRRSLARPLINIKSLLVVCWWLDTTWWGEALWLWGSAFVYMQIRVQQLAATVHFLALRKCLPRDDRLGTGQQMQNQFQPVVSVKGQLDLWHVKSVFLCFEKAENSTIFSWYKNDRTNQHPWTRRRRRRKRAELRTGDRDVLTSMSAWMFDQCRTQKEEIWFIVAEKKRVIQSLSYHLPITIWSLSDLRPITFRSPSDRFSDHFPISLRPPSDYFPISFRSLSHLLPTFRTDAKRSRKRLKLNLRFV